MRSVLILFAKAPVEGRVKTRLGARIGAVRATAVCRVFVADAIAKWREFTSLADVELHTDIPTDARGELNVTRGVQTPGNLQLKLLNAIRPEPGAGRPPVIIFGSDSPTPPPAYVRRLPASGADVTLTLRGWWVLRTEVKERTL